MVFAEIVVVVMLSIFRRRVYRFLIAALAPPLILSTVLLSIPSLSAYVDAMPLHIGTENRAVLMFQNSFGECFPVQVTGTAYLDGIELPLITVPESLFRSNVIDFREVNESCREFTSIPADVYGKRYSGVVVADGVKKCISHIHRGINAVIALGLESTKGRIELCSVNYVDILEHALAIFEKNLIEVSTVWLNMLLLIYIPLIYIAISRVYTALSNESRALLATSVSRRGAVLGFTIAITITCSITALFLTSLSIATLNALHKLINLYWFIPPPSPKTAIVLMVFKALSTAFLISVVVGLRRISYA